MVLNGKKAQLGLMKISWESMTKMVTYDTFLKM